MIMEATASSRVIGSAVPTSDATDARDDSETPRLPVSMEPSHDPNCWKKRLADPVVVVERDELGVAQQPGADPELRR